MLADPVPGQPGPLAGILAGLDWAAALGASALVSTPADTPFLPAGHGRALRAAGPGPVYVVTPDPHPACALWPVALRPALRAALASGERRVRAFAEAEGAVTIPLPAECFRNINTPADLAAAEALLAARS